MAAGKKAQVIVQEELERRILHGLSCEWEAALWVLTPPHKALIRKPLFSLGNMKSKLGYWSGERREICLSRTFVLNHSWDAVREVLLHEIAHQFAEEILGPLNGYPHGPEFRKACHLLRANPEASGNFKPLDERISNNSPKTEDKVMLRVKKLMALAGSQNQFEAESAMAKAHQLVAKYNLDLVARNENRDFVSVFLGTPILRHPREDYHLACLLQDFYFVYGLWVSAYVLDKGKMGRVLEISGTVQNVKLAAYVYAFVRHFIDSQWPGYNRDKRLNRYRKTDFAVGVIEGFSSKLKAQGKNRKRLGNKNLIKITDPLLMEYTAHRYPNTVSSTTRVSSQNDDVLRDGMSVGKKMVIAKGITNKTTRGIALIEH
jgi:hypothetical protein